MNHLIIFVKNPIAGKVKTRLAQSVGDLRALEVYQELLSITRSEVSKLDAKKCLFYSEFVDLQDDWPVLEYQKYTQKGHHLGAKMLDAFENVINNTSSEPSSKYIIIGSDCAELTSEILDMAFKSLDSSDCVIGPSKDGGYYLLGMNSLIPGIFENIEWSTEFVLQQTITKILTVDKTYALLPILNDIDTILDWEAELLRRQA